MIAHGHTQHSEKKPVKYGNDRVVNLDTGIAYGNNTGHVGRMHDFSPHAVSDEPDEPDTGGIPDPKSSDGNDPATNPDTSADAGDMAAGDDPAASGTVPKKKRNPTQPEVEGNFPEWNLAIPARMKSEKKKAWQNRVAIWAKAAWDTFKKNKQIRRDGTLRLGSKYQSQSLAGWSETDLYRWAVSGKEVLPQDGSVDTSVDDPDDDVDRSGEMEGVHPAWHGVDLPDDWKEILHDKNIDDTRNKLGQAHKLKASELPSKLPDHHKALQAVWHPWKNAKSKQKDYNIAGNGGPVLGRSHVHGLPYVLRRSGKMLQGLGLPEDPRIAIIERYYPELYKELAHAGKIEMPGDDPDIIEARIQHMRTTGVNKSKKKTANAAKNEIAERVTNLKDTHKHLFDAGVLTPSIIDNLKADIEQGKLDHVRTTLDALDDDEADMKQESVTERYKRYLREGKKALPNKLATLPLSERYAYFKKMLTEQASE